MTEYTRKTYFSLLSRIAEAPKFIQIVMGPRQVGKTTCMKQIERSASMPVIYSSADSAGIPDASWIRSKWLEARSLLKSHKTALLILDETQLVPEWQTTVKALWDEDRFQDTMLHVMITGSSALLLKKGTESLAGRFEKHELLQWDFEEMNVAFGYSLEEFILFGGYPGAASIRTDENRWKEYIQSSLIETVLTKDIIALTTIRKPSLLKQLFKLACMYPAEIVSYTKFLGQLVDAGNVTTLYDYKICLEDAFFLTTLDKWSGSEARKRASKPKWIIKDNALVTAMQNLAPSQIKNTSLYGRLFENAIISHMLKLIPHGYYWREKDFEVDHVLEYNGKLYAIEIKSGNKIRSRSGLNEFHKRHPNAQTLIIGGGGVPAETFLKQKEWIW